VRYERPDRLGERDEVEGLREERVRFKLGSARVQVGFRAIGVAARQHDRKLLESVVGPYFIEELKAVHLRHRDIAENQAEPSVFPTRIENFPRLDAVRGFDGFDIVERKEFRENCANFGIIIDEEEGNLLHFRILPKEIPKCKIGYE
jgi:hypothetical protein